MSGGTVRWTRTSRGDASFMSRSSARCGFVECPDGSVRPVQLRRSAVRGPRRSAVLLCLLLVAVCSVPAGLGRVPVPDRLVRTWVNSHQDGGAFATLDAVIRAARWQWICLALILLCGVLAL